VKDKFDWYWNEFQQIGTDYESETEVALYDKRMREMRDIDGENQLILDLLKLPNDKGNILEIGVGTGAFIRMASGQCKNAVGIDISPVMLKYAESKIREAGLTNIKLKNAGFLTYDYPDQYFDGIVSGLAFHHLPDTWKAIALKKIHASLKPGGRLVLVDVVFDWKKETPEDYFSRIVEINTESRSNFIDHIAKEYSTLSWIMTGLLERSGFIIESDTCPNDFLHIYCVRKA